MCEILSAENNDFSAKSIIGTNYILSTNAIKYFEKAIKNFCILLQKECHQTSLWDLYLLRRQFYYMALQEMDRYVFFLGLY